MDKLKSFIKQYFVLVILIVLIILFGCLRPESFLTMSNMFTVIRQSSIMGIATIKLDMKAGMKPKGDVIFANVPVFLK